jgi:hypothetical protein
MTLRRSSQITSQAFRAVSLRTGQAESTKSHQSVRNDGAAKSYSRHGFGPHTRVSWVGAGSGDCCAGVREVELPQQGVWSSRLAGEVVEICRVCGGRASDG